MKLPTKLVLLPVLTFFVSLSASAQNPVNAYANVTSISGATLTVNFVNESYHSFENGDMVIIMQMQDNVIGTNTANVVSFGNLASIGSAGHYEVAQIAPILNLRLCQTPLF